MGQIERLLITESPPNISIRESLERRDVYIEVNGEWGGKWRESSYVSEVKIVHEFKASQKPQIKVNSWNPDAQKLTQAIKLASAIVDSWQAFWENPESWVDSFANRSQQRKQMRSEVQFFLDKFFQPSFAYLPNKSEGDRMGLLALEAKPKALGINSVSDDALTAIALNFDGEKLSVCTKIFEQSLDISMPIDCSLGELKGAIRSQVDSILERLAEDVRSDVENFSGEEKT